MIRTIFCLFALTASPAWAEPYFIAERQEGLKLVQGGKHAEAAAFFVKLAETAAKPEQKGDALRHAALATARNKQIEAALLLADLADLDKDTNNDPHWICTALMAYGEVHRDMGDKAKARLSFERAARVPGAPAVLLDEANKRLAELKP